MIIIHSRIYFLIRHLFFGYSGNSISIYAVVFLTEIPIQFNFFLHICTLIWSRPFWYLVIHIQYSKHFLKLAAKKLIQSVGSIDFILFFLSSRALFRSKLISCCAQIFECHCPVIITLSRARDRRTSTAFI